MCWCCEWLCLLVKYWLLCCKYCLFLHTGFIEQTPVSIANTGFIVLILVCCGSNRFHWQIIFVNLQIHVYVATGCFYVEIIVFMLQMFVSIWQLVVLLMQILVFMLNYMFLLQIQTLRAQILVCLEQFISFILFKYLLLFTKYELCM